MHQYDKLHNFQGARAQRVEYLLLHAFHAKKYIIPDKISSHGNETKLTKRRLNDGMEVDDADVRKDAHRDEHVKGKKGPAYAGGLVLEPRKGLYDKYILLLDFNSLYPSIIQVSFYLCVCVCVCHVCVFVLWALYLMGNIQMHITKHRWNKDNFSKIINTK